MTPSVGLSVPHRSGREPQHLFWRRRLHTVLKRCHVVGRSPRPTIVSLYSDSHTLPETYDLGRLKNSVWRTLVIIVLNIEVADTNSHPSAPALSSSGWSAVRSLVSTILYSHFCGISFSS